MILNCRSFQNFYVIFFFENCPDNINVNTGVSQQLCAIKQKQLDFLSEVSKLLVLKIKRYIMS